MRVQTYSLTQLHDLQVSFHIVKLTDENKILFGATQYPDVQHQEMFSCQLFVNGIGVLPIKRTKFKNFLLFDEKIIFNCKYRDLSYNSYIAIDIWSTQKSYDENKPLGSTVVSLFTDKLKLRQGKHHLMIWPDQLADCSLTTSTPGLVSDKNIDELNFITQKVELYEKGRQNGKLLNNNSQQSLKIKLLYTYKLIPAAFLEVQFPVFNYPVIFEQQTYTIQTEANNILNSKGYSNASTIASQKANQKMRIQSFDDVFLFNDPDFNQKLSDPLEELFFDMMRQSANENPKQLIPSAAQTQKMDQLVNRPQRMQLKPNEKLLFHKYRYSLMKKKQYLIPFLHSVQWNNQKEQVEALELLKNWQKIGYDDAFHLLTNVFCANNKYNKLNSKPPQPMKAIRQYAVSILSECSNKQLCNFMLQLVVAIRYEAFDDSALTNMLAQKSLRNQELATLYYWYLRAQSEYIPNPKDAQAQFTHQLCKIYEGKLNDLLTGLKEGGSDIQQIINQQIIFVNYIKQIARYVKGMKKDIDKKKEQLRNRIMAIDWSQFKNLLLPIDTRHVLKCPIKSQCTVFSSATTPLKLTFQSFVDGNPSKAQFIFKVGDDLRQDQLILQMFLLMDQLLKNFNLDMRLTPYKAMACNKQQGFVEFVPKSNILQPIIKSQNKQTLGTYLEKLNNPKCGIYQQLMKKNGQSELTQSLIAQYSSQVSSIIMDNYYLSCAGYCAITYFFGIGDRHLQNLLITDEGKFFHIDFGFILGKDPKPYSPPIKIRRQMVQAMGGMGSEMYKKFMKKCVQVYKYLRKFSKLITSLVQLMIDSGIKDLSPDTLNNLYDKFQLGLDQINAQKHFMMVFDQSLNAVFGSINDTIHIWAAYWR